MSGSSFGIVTDTASFTTERFGIGLDQGIKIDHTLEVKSNDGGVVNGSSIIAKFHGNYSGIQGLMVSRSDGANVKLLTNHSTFGGGLESSDALRFSTNGNTLSNPSMYIETDGKVGIGNFGDDGNFPSAELHISTSTYSPKILLEATNDGTEPGLTANMEIKGYGGRAKGIFFTDSNNPNNKWFVGPPYLIADNKDFQIGFSDVSDTSYNLPHYRVSASVYIRRDFVSGSINNLALVGINTNSPTNPLHIAQASNFGSIALTSLKSASLLVGTTTSGVGIDPNEIVFQGNAGHIGTITDHVLAFVTNGTVKSRILGNGNFGIGNSNPENKLVVGGTISGSSNLYIKGMSEDTAGSFPNVVTYDTATGRFYYTGSYGSGGGSTDGIFAETGSSFYATTNNIEITGSLKANGNIHFSDNLSIGLADNTGNKFHVKTETSFPALFENTSTTTGMGIQFKDGSTTKITSIGVNGDALQLLTDNNVRLQIDDSGKVGIGRESSNYKLEVQGDMAATADVIAYLGSDRRLKDNIKPIENPIEKIKQIGGYTFDWNDNQSTYEGNDVGVIAQEIEKVLPSLVNDREDGYKGVKYDKIVALLIEGIKDQQKQIDDLKAQINGSK